MKKETTLIAFSNQKGGVGKSTMTVLLASYLHYTKNLNVAVANCDAPQHSVANMRERDKKVVMKATTFKHLMMMQHPHLLDGGTRLRQNGTPLGGNFLVSEKVAGNQPHP